MQILCVCLYLRERKKERKKERKSSGYFSIFDQYLLYTFQRSCPVQIYQGEYRFSMIVVEGLRNSISAMAVVEGLRNSISTMAVVEGLRNSISAMARTSLIKQNRI